MRLSLLGELPLVDSIRGRFRKTSKAVLTGIGDDAAVLRPDRRKLLLTTDMMVEGVHFDLAYTTPYQLGHKLVSVNVSDIYAMGGRPAFALLGLALPGGTDEKFVWGLMDGVKDAAEAYGVSVVGGDVTSAPGGISLAATVAGYARKPVGRRGAKPGEKLYVTGPLGESRAGLGLLGRIGRPVDFEKPLNRPLKWGVMRPLLFRHLMPEAARPPRRASSMIDISDGLFIDLYRLCKESGVGARIYKEKIPITGETAEAARHLRLDQFAVAAGGGEDYQLLFSAPGGRPKGATCIGEVTRRGLVLVDENGGESAIRPKGYEHFKRQGKR